MEVEAMGHVDYVLLGAQFAQGYESHFLSPLLGPSSHLKPHLKSQRKDEELNTYANVNSFAEDELSLKCLPFYFYLPLKGPCHVQ